jgi:DNA polymerase-3 subunit beta
LKFKIKTKDLKEVISAVSKVVDPRPATPSLQGLYLRTKENLLEVVGSDLDVVLKARTEVKTEVEGETLVNARVLSEIVRKLPTGEATFSDIGSELKVEIKKMDFELRKLDEKTYPEALLEENSKDNTEEVETIELFESIKKVGIASSPEGGRPVLTGVYFNNKNNKTELVATDSYRLATHSLSEIPIKDIGIISYRALNEAIRVFENSEEPIKINSNERELHFYNDKFSASLRKLEGTFPEYENLFPKETLFSIEVKKAELLESLDRATVVAEGFIPVQIILESNETLKITTVNKDIGGGNEEVSIKTLGVGVEDVSGFEMSFNPNYFMQGIEVLDGDTVYIRFSGNEKPVVIQGEVENYKYLLMPVRTNQ